VFEAAEADTWPDVFNLIAEYRPDSLLQLTNATFASNPTKLAALAVAQRLPAAYGEREFVDAGGLMSYGVSFSDQWRRAAGYVDKILKGAQPSELPIEQPTKFEFVINLKTAKAIGVAVPTPTLLRATEVIE
jgi:putative ABC transport system substrate-binding protein